ncbi:MAG: GNAT family N-acetyltransferase [Lachnospiraceae bacterium]
MKYWTKVTAGLQQAPEAQQIRQEVFVEEQGFLDEFDEVDAQAFHVVLYEDDRAIATGRLFDGPQPRQKMIGRVAVRKSHRRQGQGERVMAALEELAAAQNALEIKLSAQMTAREFYEKLGYAAHGEIYPDQGCPHIAMTKKIQPTVSNA